MCVSTYMCVWCKCFMCVRVCACMRVCVFLHTCVCGVFCACVCVCVHACVHVCVCVCVQNVAHKDWTDTNVVVEFINIYSLGAKIQCFVQGILNSKVFKDSTSQLSIQNQHTMQIKSELTKVYIILFF